MYDFLKKVPLFSDLSDSDLKHLCQLVEEVRLAAGEMLFEEGSHGEQAYIVKEGQLEVLKSSDGREVLLYVVESEDLIGEMALLEHMPRMASIRARSDSLLYAIHQEQFDHLLDNSPAALRTMFQTVLARYRDARNTLLQSEKMVQLGTLAAGVAHELNNPAAAVKRGTDQLHDALSEFGNLYVKIGRLTFSAEQRVELDSLAGEIQKRAAVPVELNALLRSDREFELESWLEQQNVDNAWELAPTLVDLNYDIGQLTVLAKQFSVVQLPMVIGWLSAIHSVYNLLAEIGQGAARMSGIIKALTSYSYLDQAPVQAVDIHQGLDNTLLIVQHKLKKGISVRREYRADLPQVEAYGSELNQVWTNLIANAADALNGQGEIVLRTGLEGDWVVVEIEDNGPGVPPEIQSRIFDPFFTTKAPGDGTGLGLDISYKIIVHKHRGDIRLFSEPGQTCFQVRLPLNPTNDQAGSELDEIVPKHN
jgi:signal transduction histidine kinase